MKYAMELSRARQLGIAFAVEGKTREEVSAWLATSGYGPISARRILAGFDVQTARG